MQTLPERTGQRPALQRVSVNLTTLNNILQESTSSYWLERGFAHKRAQEWLQAADCFKHALQREPKNFMACFQCSLAYAKLNDADGCIEYFIQPFFIDFYLYIYDYITLDEFNQIKCFDSSFTHNSETIHNEHYSPPEHYYAVATSYSSDKTSTTGLKYDYEIYWPNPRYYLDATNTSTDVLNYIIFPSILLKSQINLNVGYEYLEYHPISINIQKMNIVISHFINILEQNFELYDKNIYFYTFLKICLQGRIHYRYDLLHELITKNLEGKEKRNFLFYYNLKNYESLFLLEYEKENPEKQIKYLENLLSITPSDVETIHYEWIIAELDYNLRLFYEV